MTPVALFGLLGLVAGCAHDRAAQPGETSMELTAERAAQAAMIMDHVHTLTRDIGPRVQGSAAARRAADHIAGELEELGLQVERHVVGEQVLPAIAVGPMNIMAEQRGYFGDANLVVRLGPPASAANKALLFMAHYDTVYGSPGAVDNAASVAVLLVVARKLARRPPSRPVIIAFTAAEEVRLAGARALFQRLGDQVGLAVSLDLLGSNGELTLNGLSSLLGRDWLVWLAGAAQRAGVTVAAPIPHRVISRLWLQIERSDHGVFTHHQIPAFHLYSRPAGALYLPYHTWLDTADHVAARVVVDAARLVEMLARTPGPLPRAGGDAGMWLPAPGRHWIAPSWAIALIECLLVFWIVYMIMCLLGDARADARRARGSVAAGLAAGLSMGSVSWLGGHATAWLIAHACLRLPAWISGHPMPWAHHPARHVLLAVIIAAAASALLMMLVARRRASRGRASQPRWYLIAALLCCVLAGALLLALGLHELAWIPLVHGALLAGTARVTRLAPALALSMLSLVPLLGPLHPDTLREAVFNGFLTPGIPLALVLAVMLLPAALGLTYIFMRFSNTDITSSQSVSFSVSRRSLAVAGVVLVAAVAVAIIISFSRPVCDARGFTYWNLTCELPDIDDS